MHRLRIGGVRPTSIDPQIAAVHPAQFLQLLDERSALRLSFRIALRPAHQHSDAPHPLGLLRAHRERPRDCRAAEQRDELASSQGWHGLSPLRSGLSFGSRLNKNGHNELTRLQYSWWRQTEKKSPGLLKHRAFEVDP